MHGLCLVVWFKSFFFENLKRFLSKGLKRKEKNNKTKPTPSSPNSPTIPFLFSPAAAHFS
jgi:hypothetical protein